MFKYNRIWLELDELNHLKGFSIEPIEGWVLIDLSDQDKKNLVCKDYSHLKLVSGRLIKDEGLESVWKNKKALEKELYEIQAYLKQTDWTVLKRMDLNYDNHPEITEARALKRIRMNEIQVEVDTYGN